MEEPKIVKDVREAMRTAHTITDPREKRLFIKQSVHKRGGISDEQARLLALLEHGADSGDLEALRQAFAGGLTAETELYNETPLALAIRWRQLESVRELLKAGAEVNRDSEGSSPLCRAVGQPEVMSLLLAAGAEVNHRNSYGGTPLTSACWGGFVADVKILLTAGANINQPCTLVGSLRDAVPGMTPLMLAGRFAHAPVVKILIAAGADLNLKDAEGHTALNWAQMKTSNRYVKVAELLAKAGAASGRPVVDMDAPEPDFRKAAKEPKFLAAVEKLRQVTGKPKRALQGVEGPIRGGAGFLVPESRVKEIVAELQTEMLGQGAYLFATRDLTDRNGDALALLPTTDVYEVIAAVETQGPNSNIYTGDLIRWLKKLEDPLRITGAGRDYLEGKFTAPIKDPLALAHKINQLCPDGDEGPEADRALAQQLETTRELFLWWD